MLLRRPVEPSHRRPITGFAPTHGNRHLQYPRSNILDRAGDWVESRAHQMIMILGVLVSAPIGDARPATPRLLTAQEDCPGPYAADPGRCKPFWGRSHPDRRSAVDHLDRSPTGFVSRGGCVPSKNLHLAIALSDVDLFQ